MATAREETITFKRTTYYKRWNIDRTARDGWRPKDMSISATFEEGHEPDEATMRALARRCADEAMGTCNELNGNDNEARRYAGNENGER